MKALYITVLVSCFTFGLNAQIVFESNFDTWMDGMPTDWFGSKTQIEGDSVAQNMDDPTYGSALAELTNVQSQHRRFTSQPISVTEGETYEVEVWVRGNGDIRTNIFDGDLDGGDFGYQNYNAYQSISGNSLISFVQTIIPDTTTSAAELILSTRNGVVQVDRVEFRVGVPVEAQAATVYEIQFTEDASGDSPLLNEFVSTTGVVTAVAANGYWIQDGDGAWNGIFAFDSDNIPSIGDEVEVEATVVEYTTAGSSLTELDNVQSFTVIGQSALPSPSGLGTNDADVEDYEGVLVTTVGECIELPNDFGEWVIDDGSGPIAVDDRMFEFTPELGTWYSVTGPMDESFDRRKVLPRDADDVSIASSLVESEKALFSVYPNPTQGELFIDLLNEGGQLMNVILLDLTGKVLKATRVDSDILQLDLSDFRAGTYVLQVVAEDRFTAQPIVIQ